MANIITMGEIMCRLSPPGATRLVQATAFNIVYGGGEANVAVSLAGFGHDVHFVTKLPNNELGDAALASLKAHNVQTNAVARSGSRLGLYFLETGFGIRPSKVIYDRAGSAMAEATDPDFDFDAIFANANWFHWTGITPALSRQAAQLTKKALIAAKKHQVTVSVDLNYRKKLWSPKQAQAVMTDLMQYVDVMIGNEEDAQLSLGLTLRKTNVTSGELIKEDYLEMFSSLSSQYGFQLIATTLRESYSASKNGWQALLFDGERLYESKRYLIEPILDRVGGGDAFSAGLIHGLLTRDKEQALEFAAAASALKHTIYGDFNLVTENEVDTLVTGDLSGRIQR
ncbi:MAG: sugar kinase [Candidatus Izemoplasmatales bacterium]|nr:sugar kinase [Candidatus Izemoplasmatales bacterium]